MISETSSEVFLPTALRRPLTADLHRAKVIIDAIAVCIAVDMRLHLVVENTGFKLMVKMPEPPYNVPSHVHESVYCAVLHKPAQAADNRSEP